MSLPVELDRKIQHRFDKLIGEVEALLAELDEYDEEHYLRFREWQVKASGLLKMLFGESTDGEKFQQIIDCDSGPGVVALDDPRPSRYIFAPSLRETLATMKSIRDNYVNGFYDGLEQQIIANVSADYMEQAETLLSEGFHVPAAVLCGAVLEDALRRLCAKQTPPIETTKSNGDKKTLEPLIQDLQKVKVFNKLVADQLRAWTKNRNYAAHGEFNEFRREDVELMLSGVRHFLAAHL